MFRDAEWTRAASRGVVYEAPLCRGISSGTPSAVEQDVEGAFPKDVFAERAQLVGAVDDRQEVVARQLPDDRGELRAPVREENLGLAQPAGVPEDLARGGVRRGVLRLAVEADVEVAERDPRGLAAPAGVDALRAEREQALESGDGLGRLLGLEHALEREGPGGDGQHQRIVGVRRRPAPRAGTRPRSSVWVMRACST